MSSLAGALGPHGIHAPIKSEPGDVKHRIKDETKSEEDEEEMDDLFGNDAALEVDVPADVGSPEASGQESERLPSPEREHRRALEYEEEDAPPEAVVELQEADVSFPNLPVPKSSDGDKWVIRMPNFVKIDTKPFHPETYMGPEHDEEEGQQAQTLREQSMTIKLKVENTVRWRWTKNEFGDDVRQSNSRVIRWSDGTLSLRLGKEYFDINQSIDTSGGPAAPLTAGGKSQGLTYLVAQHKRSQVLQAEALIAGYMTLRPTGMQSETHRMLVKAVSQKHNKVARLRLAPDPVMDPEREMQEMIKKSSKKAPKRKQDHDDESSGRSRRRSRKQYDSDEDIYGDAGSDDDDHGKKSKRKGGDEEGGKDDLDKLDAMAEKQRKKLGNDDAMDVESEEEDEAKIRKASRTRRQATYDDEDDEDE
ncbi:Leo1-domain-containing protein [Armillaria luteobubalina]|uniref:Leo1-domain-containing protein n=1 Tax=Armillaria luteobubalina TaxID=153913 RepID=A0AA39QG61_9AGAR|nr:Leo1-domain-containing protein [Armillaria luteobubalina]